MPPGYMVAVSTDTTEPNPMPPPIYRVMTMTARPRRPEACFRRPVGLR